MTLHAQRCDFFNGLASAHCLQDVIDVASSAVRPMGFDYCGWRARLPRPVAHQHFMTLHAVEDAVFEREVEGYYDDDTPILRHCSRSMRPLLWTGQPGADGPLFDQSPEKWEEFFASGHRGGWAQSLIDNHQQYCMFWAHSAVPLSHSTLTQVSQELQWVAAAVTSCIYGIKDHTAISLTIREKSVLSWVGEDLNCDQIAERMTLTCSSVKFYLKNAMRKLNVPRPNLAVTQALFAGYIH